MGGFCAWLLPVDQKRARLRAGDQWGVGPGVDRNAFPAGSDPGLGSQGWPSPIWPAVPRSPGSLQIRKVSKADHLPGAEREMVRPGSWAERAWEPRQGVPEAGRWPGTPGGQGHRWRPRWLLRVLLFLHLFQSPPTPADTALRKCPVHFTFKSSNYVSQTVLIRQRKLQATTCGLQISVSWHSVSAGASDHMTFRLTVFGGLRNQQRAPSPP